MWKYKAVSHSFVLGPQWVRKSGCKLSKPAALPFISCMADVSSTAVKGFTKPCSSLVFFFNVFNSLSRGCSRRFYYVVGNTVWSGNTFFQKAPCFSAGLLKVNFFSTAPPFGSSRFV